MANSISSLSAKANRDRTLYENLSEKYGGSVSSWKAAGLATLLGADLVDGASASQNLSIEAKNISSRQAEIEERAGISIANIGQQERKVAGLQKAHFVKSGVKIEGSAIDVIQETINNATEAMIIRQREADFVSTQLNVQKRLTEQQQSTVATRTLLNFAGSYATASLK